MKQSSRHSVPNSRKYPPAKDAEARENQLISLAYDLVEKRLREGTATSQETVHFLKLGSTKEKLEKELMEKQIELTSAKSQNIASSEKNQELYTNALAAFRSYQGEAPQGDEKEYDH